MYEPSRWAPYLAAVRIRRLRSASYTSLMAPPVHTPHNTHRLPLSASGQPRCPDSVSGLSITALLPRFPTDPPWAGSNRTVAQLRNFTFCVAYGHDVRLVWLTVLVGGQGGRPCGQGVVSIQARTKSGVSDIRSGPDFKSDPAL